jgi:hypothetical protein
MNLKVKNMWKENKVPILIFSGIAISIGLIVWYNKQQTAKAGSSQSSLIDKMSRADLISLLIRKSGLDASQLATLTDDQLRQQLKQIS